MSLCTIIIFACVCTGTKKPAPTALFFNCGFARVSIREDPTVNSRINLVSAPSMAYQMSNLTIEGKIRATLSMYDRRY